MGRGGVNPIPTCIEPLIVIVTPVRAAALVVTLMIADTAYSKAVKAGTTIEDGWTNDFMVRDSLGLAGFTDAEAIGVSRTSWIDTNGTGDVEAADGDVRACFEGTNYGVVISTESVGDTSYSTISVEATVCAWRIRKYE